LIDAVGKFEHRVHQRRDQRPVIERKHAVMRADADGLGDRALNLLRDEADVTPGAQRDDGPVSGLPGPA
jgi:hypothetical protein